MDQIPHIPDALNSRLTNTAVIAALRAGELLKKGYGSTFQIDSKDKKHNLVTEYDRLCEKTIIEYISEQFPDHSFLAEESGTSKEGHASIKWIIDPLDGTVNFAYGIPLFCISIAASLQNTLL